MNKKIPKKLQEKQELERQKTINSVLNAISDLKALKAPIKIKGLMDHTGLSRSVFAKEHIRKIIYDNGIGFAIPKCENNHKKTVKKSPIKTLKNKLIKKDKYIAEILAQNEELKRECELLRGKLFLLMSRQNMD